jgi:hypothetical protein
MELILVVAVQQFIQHQLIRSLARREQPVEQACEYSSADTFPGLMILCSSVNPQNMLSAIGCVSDCLDAISRYKSPKLSSSVPVQQGYYLLPVVPEFVVDQSFAAGHCPLP